MGDTFASTNFWQLIGQVYLSVYVIAAMAAGVICCLLRRKRYHMAVGQVLLLCFLHAIFGNIGDRVTARIALGAWGGGCWYGVPLMITVSILLLKNILKRSFGEIGDISAAGICCIHIVSKIACIFQGCCTGVVMWYAKDGNAVHFPCRGFEIMSYCVILFFLLRFEKKGMAKGMLWEIYIIWYAVIRYIAAWLREIAIDWKPFFLWIPAARLWTFVICVVGVIILAYHFKKIYGNKPTIKDLALAVIGRFPDKKKKKALAH